jgi:hypothetical protein
MSDFMKDVARHLLDRFAENHALSEKVRKLKTMDGHQGNIIKRDVVHMQCATVVITVTSQLHNLLSYACSEGNKSPPVSPTSKCYTTFMVANLVYFAKFEVLFLVNKNEPIFFSIQIFEMFPREFLKSKIRIQLP